MGITGVKIKIMPDSPSADLRGIEDSTKKIVEEAGGRNRNYEIEPIAFGLKAVIAFFEIPEDLPIEEIENSINEVEHVSSSQVIDMRKIA